MPLIAPMPGDRQPLLFLRDCLADIQWQHVSWRAESSLLSTASRQFSLCRCSGPCGGLAGQQLIPLALFCLQQGACLGGSGIGELHADVAFSAVHIK